MFDANDYTLNEASASELLIKLHDLKLDDYYNFEGNETLPSVTIEKIKLLLSEPKFFEFDGDTGKLFSIDDDGVRDELHESFFKTFDSSNRWVSSRIPSIPNVFSNSTVGELSQEMENFYICLVISAVFCSEYKDEFLERCKHYDFPKWCGEFDDFGLQMNFTSLYNEWFNIGTKKLKMVISACKFKISLEKNDAFTFRTVDLPSDVASNLELIKNRVVRIRMNFEEGELSPMMRRKKSKLEIKLLNREMEEKIESVLHADEELYQLWRLFKISSEEMSPDVANTIRRNCRQQAIEDKDKGLFLQFGDEFSGSDLYAYSKRLERTMRKAWARKFRSEQFELYKLDPKQYVAPVKQ